MDLVTCRDMLTSLRRILSDSTRRHRNIWIPDDLECGLNTDPIAPIGFEFSPGEYSNAVPWSASPDPKEGKRGYANWFTNFEGVVHKDGTSVLVFPSHFMYENPISGEVVYNQIGFRCDDYDPKVTIDETVRIYEWLFERDDGVKCHPRIVHWMGKTNTGFLLQRLRPGPMSWNKPTGEGEFLRLYWSWAMQLLTGLAFLHEHGVHLGSFSEDMLWIRGDFSIAIASLLGAGCASLRIAVAGYEIPISSPWHEVDFETVEALPEEIEDEDWWDDRLSGRVKADLVDWANVVFGWMSGDEELLRFHESAEKPAPEVQDEVSKRWRKEYRYRGELVGFRRLEKGMLGDVIVDVLMGQYESAEEVLCGVRKTIVEFGGGKVCGELGDEVEGVALDQIFELAQNEDGGNEVLRLRCEDTNIGSKEKA